MPKTSTSAKSEGASFRRALTRWYGRHGRHALPWRLTRDPYAVLVSEVMLQQTQVDRVLPYYTAWLERWPHLAALAAASPADVIREWRGLGYNRRALNLHRLAVEVVERHGAAMPTDGRQLRGLPGVGEYTASAIGCFAREESVPVADTNIARVLARAVFGAPNQREVPPAEIRRTAESLLPASRARDHNLALMDLGALVCTARAPACEECPVRSMCAWRLAGSVTAVPVPRPAPKFETTARFARGRIIDHLRGAPATECELAAALPGAHGARVSEYLAGLLKDGLAVERGDGTWSLPA